MSAKSGKRSRSNTMVDITKLRICADLTTGQICLGIPNSDGEIVTLDKNTLFVDVSNDFYEIMRNIVEIKLAAVKNENKKSIINDSTDFEAAKRALEIK